MTRIKLVKNSFLAANRVMILFVIFAALVEQCLASSLGAKCQHDMDCTDFIKGSTCSMNGYCECAPYFVQYNVTTCLSSQLLGGDCTLADQCTMKVANSSCLDGACRCVEGFLQFRKHTCLGPAHPGAVCYSHAHCQMNDKRSHCDFLIPNLFGRCQCTSPAKQYGGMCIMDDSSIEVDGSLGHTTTYVPLITPPSTVFRPIDLISHYEITTQGKPLLISNEENDKLLSTEIHVGLTKLPEITVSPSNEQADGEVFDFHNNDQIASSAPTIEEEVIHQEVTSDDYPYKIENEDQSSINEEDMDQVEESDALPVAPENETATSPHDDTQLNNEDLNHRETESEHTPEGIDHSEHESHIQSSSEAVDNVDQESNKGQSSEAEQDILPEQETETEILPKVENQTQANQQNKDDEKLGSEAEEAGKPENLSDVSKIEAAVEESAATPENSQEHNNLPGSEKEEESPIEQPNNEDNLQTPNPIGESTELLPSYEENLSEQQNTHEPNEDESQSVQDLTETLNSESQEEKHDKTGMKYEEEQGPLELNSVEKDNENFSEQSGNKGDQMEESHYRPSSDVHGQEEDNNEEITANIDEENALEPLQIINGDQTLNEPNKNEEQDVSQVDHQTLSLETQNNSVLSEEADTGHDEEHIKEENAQEEAVQGTNSEQSIEKEEGEEETQVLQETSTEHFSEEETQTEHTTQRIQLESSSEALNEEFGEEVEKQQAPIDVNQEEPEKEEEKDEPVDNGQGNQDEKIEDNEPVKEDFDEKDHDPQVNKKDQQIISHEEDINNSEVIESIAEEGISSPPQEQSIQTTEDQPQQIAQEGSNAVVQETIEELLHEAVQALAEKETQEPSKEEQSVTEKPVSESEEKILQTLQEDTMHFGDSDELIYQPESHSEHLIENTQQKEHSTNQSIEQENLIASQQSESEEVQKIPIKEELLPESITEAVNANLMETLPEKVNQISAEENVTELIKQEETNENPELVEESQNNTQDSAQENELPQSTSHPKEEEELAAESIENAIPVKNEVHNLVPKTEFSDLPAISSNEAISHENQLLEAEEIPNSPAQEEQTNITELENESSNETVQQVHDSDNIIESAEVPNHNGNDEKETTEANRGEETITLNENSISSNENTIIDSNEKTESDNTLGTHPDSKPIDQVKEIDTKAENNELLENEQATSIHFESEHNSDHEPLVHPTFESGETQVIENVNDNEAQKETQSGSNANESEHDTTEYVPLVVAESETLSTPIAAIDPEFSETEKFEQFEDHHLKEDGSANEEDKVSEVATNSPELELIEENIENDLKASGDSAFNEKESVLSILSGLIENEEEGSGTPLPSVSTDDLKAEETIHSEQSPETGSYYPSLLSNLLMSTKSEDIANSKPSTSGPLIDNLENVTTDELPFDLSFVSTNDPEELMSDNLVVETTPSINSGSNSEESLTTEVPDILEITTQTMLGLASRVTLMEPAAPVATTLKPFMTIDEDFSTTSSSLNMDSSITSKPVRKRVELGSGPVSLGLSCNSDRQCQLADPNTICSDQGICDCASKTEAKCSAERTGCSAGTFQCRSSGVCISWFFVCDGRPDCTDASDEECTFNARLNQTCPTESFRCEHSGRCISRAALCDGKKQCPHGEDELECDSLRNEGGHCPPNTFRCNSGECLPEYEYCNAIISCKDGSDEPPHLCGLRSVPNIFLRLLTAVVVDNTSARNSASGINAICPHRCSNGRCRSTAIVCSGRDGCGDGTDEQTCSVCRCPAPANPSASAQQPSMPLWK